MNRKIRKQTEEKKTKMNLIKKYAISIEEISKPSCVIQFADGKEYNRIKLEDKLDGYGQATIHTLAGVIADLIDMEEQK